MPWPPMVRKTVWSTLSVRLGNRSDRHDAQRVGCRAQESGGDGQVIVLPVETSEKTAERHRCATRIDDRSQVAHIQRL